uniref:Uncharacterized protein n=1 Tax=Meloidogyne javanica TaxID=6303 RepID=A0A915MMI1_MELJA
MLLLLSIVVAVVYYVTLYPVDNPVPGEYEVVGSEKVTSEAGSEKRSEASPESEGAGSEFEGAPVPVPIYLVGPVEVRDMKEKGEDSKQSKGRSERSTGTASKEEKGKSHRRSSKLPVPTSAVEAGADGKTSKAKKRSGSSGRHRHKKDASSSKSSRTVGSTSDGGSKASKSAASSKSDAGKVRTRKSGGGSKGRKGQKDGSRSRSRSASSGKSSKKDRKHATPQTPSKKDLSKKPDKICQQKRKKDFVYTASQSAACGVNLEIDKEYLIGGKYFEDNTKKRVSLCGLAVNWDDLSEQLKEDLNNGNLDKNCTKY